MATPSEEQEWIESPDGWGPGEEVEDDGCRGGGMLDLFGKEDPHEAFTHELRLRDGTRKRIRLRGFKVDSDAVDRSTGVTLWQAAPRLADYLQDHAELCDGTSVLELGAGLGLCGIAAHCLGAKMMVMTDGDTHALQQMRENVQHNCDNNDTISCRQLLWGSPFIETFSDEKFDVVLGADVIYTEASIAPLFDTVAYFLKKTSGRFVLSRFNKWNGVDDEVVIKAAKARCLHCTQPSEGILIFGWTKTKGSGA